MDVAIIDYGAGNVKSLQFALERLGVQARLTHDWELIQKADKVIFPGQGAAASAMKKLTATGLINGFRSWNNLFWGSVWECNFCAALLQRETARD